MVKVEQQVRRLDSLVTDLLDFARPAEAKRVRVRLDEIAAVVIDLVQRDHPAVELRTTGEGEAIADANLVQQVLLNLVLNAIQAMDGGPGHTVLLSVRDGAVLVNDDGPGIPEENLEKIFSPFFTTRTRGTGLGLAICRQATAAMGGALTLSSGDLRGAAFLLELPLV
jgi:signal transduction histidine kinase